MIPNDVKKWIETKMADGYDYRPKPGTVKVIEDQQVDRTFAAQFFDQNYGEVTHLLFVTGNETGTIADILERTLEEVEFSEWPPKSGSLQFFW